MRIGLITTLFVCMMLALVFLLSVLQPRAETEPLRKESPEEGSDISLPNTQTDSVTTTGETHSTQRVEAYAESSLPTASTKTSTVLLPPLTGMYFGAFAEFDAYEDKVSTKAVTDFESLIGKDIAWGYFSNNWFDGIEFPKQQVDALRAAGITPYIRMMARTNFNATPRNWVYTHERIADGVYDEELRAWARAARDTETPLIIEFGTEINGDWFPWNGKYNGAGDMTGYGDDTKPDGPERFIAAYRHIIDVFREEDVENVTWVYHVDAISDPNEHWNGRMSYYPGDDYIDWIGVSVYGAQENRDPWTSFTEVFDGAYKEIAARTAKPIAIVEFGVVEGRDADSKAQWLRDAFTALRNGSYPRVRALSYWHSRWQNDDGSITNLRIDSSAESLEVVVDELQHPMYVSQTRFGPR